MYGQLPTLTTTSGTSISGYPVEILNPPKTAVLRLPTNAELTAYLSAQRTIITDLGRGKSTSEEIPTPKATAKLFAAIRLDKRTSYMGGVGGVGGAGGEAPDGEEWDDAEMTRGITRLLTHRLVSCSRSGAEYAVQIATPFDDHEDTDDGPITAHCTHVVSIPMERHLAEYRRFNLKITDLPDNKQEWRTSIDSFAKLYDAIHVEHSGYAPGTEVPVHHKRTVVIAVLNKLAQLEPVLDPNS